LWLSTNATEANIQNWGPVPVNGQLSVSPFVTTNYRIDVKNGFWGSLVSSNALVVVKQDCNLPAPTPTPTPTPTQTPIPQATVSINASSTSICVGESTRLFWNSYNANVVTLSNFGNVGSFGDVIISPNTTTTYTVTASNYTSFNSDSVTIGVRVCNVNSQADLRIDKTVRHFSSNSSELETVFARPGNILEFILRVQSIGNTEARDVLVTDSLPSELSYVNGTTTVDGVIQSDDRNLINGGIYMGTLNPGRNIVIRFRAIVKDVVTGSPLLAINTGFLSASNVGTKQDIARVNISTGIVAEALTVRTGSFINWMWIAWSLIFVGSLTMLGIRRYTHKI